MNNRIAFFGTNEKNERLLIAIEFVEADKKVNIYTFGQEHLKEEFTKKMFKEWAESKKTIEFPDPHNKLEQSVLSGESLLPYEITSDKPETVRRAQNAWALRLLTSQLFENLKAELSLFGNKVDEAKEYLSENWAEAKKYAGNLGVQLKDKNITKANFDELKASLDDSFGKLKVQLAKRNEELEVKSAVLVDELKQKIVGYGEKMETITKNNQVFNDLKALHEKVKKAKITQAKRKELWDMLDGLFTKAKTKQKEYWNSRNDNRITGLQKAINRMENSINYDRKEIDFQKRRMNNSAIKSLEMQLRQAKLNVAEDKIKSKEEKLAEMHVLLSSLNKKKKKQDPVTAKKDNKAEEQAKPKATATADKGKEGNAKQAKNKEAGATAKVAAKKTVENGVKESAVEKTATTDNTSAEPKKVVEEISEVKEEVLIAENIPPVAENEPTVKVENKEVTEPIKLDATLKETQPNKEKVENIIKTETEKLIEETQSTNEQVNKNVIEEVKADESSKESTSDISEEE